jgi:hypothetical protein
MNFIVIKFICLYTFIRSIIKNIYNINITFIDTSIIDIDILKYAY